MSAAARRNIKTRGYKVRDVKLAATGKAKAGKSNMVAAAKTQWPDQQIIDDNQADALWILYLGCKTLNIVVKKHENELF